MKQELLQRTYEFSDPYLQEICDEKITAAGRDATEMVKHGITTDRLRLLSASNLAFKELPSEYELEVKLEKTVEQKQAAAIQLRNVIRTLSVRAQAWFEQPYAEQTLFAVGDLYQLTDAELLLRGRKIIDLLEKFLEPLYAKGLTQAMVDTLNELCNEFIAVQEKVRDLARNREMINHNRISRGNDIYATLLVICDKGKQIWAGHNEAKHNDYVIHQPPLNLNSYRSLSA